VEHLERLQAPDSKGTAEEYEAKVTAAWKKGRDTWYHEDMRDAKEECKFNSQQTYILTPLFNENICKINLIIILYLFNNNLVDICYLIYCCCEGLK